MYRFCVPTLLITDNGRQFDNMTFQKFCDELNIKHYFSSLAHPQVNGQVEVVNKIIKRNLKTKLEDLKGSWAEKLLKVLWVYWTTLQTSTG